MSYRRNQITDFKKRNKNRWKKGLYTSWLSKEDQNESIKNEIKNERLRSKEISKIQKPEIFYGFQSQRDYEGIASNKQIKQKAIKTMNQPMRLINFFT